MITMKIENVHPLMSSGDLYEGAFRFHSLPAYSSYPYGLIALSPTYSIVVRCTRAKGAHMPAYLLACTYHRLKPSGNHRLLNLIYTVEMHTSTEVGLGFNVPAADKMVLELALREVLKEKFDSERLRLVPREAGGSSLVTSANSEVLKILRALPIQTRST